MRQNILFSLLATVILWKSVLKRPGGNLRY